MTQPKTFGSRLPELAGASVRTVGRTLPGIAGPLAVCVGLWMLLPALGVIALGILFILIDRRVP